MTSPMPERSDIVESYLDDLLAGLRGSPGEVRRMVAEAEEHLYAGVADGLASGLEPRAAAQAAVERFGPASQVARAWTASAAPEPIAAFLRRLTAQLVPLVATGLVAIGLSGLLARAMTAIWGMTFMFADPPGTRYPASACSYWLSIHPHASTCTRAYLAESMADGLQARYLAGICGLLLFAVLAVVRRRRRLPLISAPSLLTSFTGAAVFLVAAVALTGLGVDAERVASGDGAGAWLSGAVVALPVAVGYGLAFLRSGRRLRLAA